MRCLTVRAKQLQEANGALRKTLSGSQHTVRALTDRNNKLEDVVQRANLLERQSLTQQLQTSRNKLKQRDLELRVSGALASMFTFFIPALFSSIIIVVIIVAATTSFAAIVVFFY